MCIGPHLYSNLVTNALANSLIYCINILIHVTNAFSDGGQNEYRIEALQWKMHLCMNIFSFSCLQPVRIHLEAYCHLVCVTRCEALPGGAGQCHGENDRQVTGVLFRSWGAELIKHFLSGPTPTPYCTITLRWYQYISQKDYPQNLKIMINLSSLDQHTIVNSVVIPQSDHYNNLFACFKALFKS